MKKLVIIFITFASIILLQPKLSSSIINEEIYRAYLCDNIEFRKADQELCEYGKISKNTLQNMNLIKYSMNKEHW